MSPSARPPITSRIGYGTCRRGAKISIAATAMSRPDSSRASCAGNSTAHDSRRASAVPAAPAVAAEDDLVERRHLGPAGSVAQERAAVADVLDALGVVARVALDVDAHAV